MFGVARSTASSLFASGLFRSGLFASGSNTAERAGADSGLLSPASSYYRSPSVTTLASSLDAALIAVVCYVITIKIWETSHLYAFILIASVVYAGAGVIVRTSRQPTVGLSLMDIGLFAVVVVEAISYAESSYRPNSLLSLGEVSFLFLFYCLVRSGMHADFQRVAIFGFLSLLGFWISSRALYSFYLHYRRLSALGFTDLTNFKHLFGMVGPDGYSTGERITTLLLLLPFPLMLVFRFRKHRARWLLAVPVITMVAALCMTFSRGIYVSIGAFAVVADVMFWRFRLMRSKTIFIWNAIVLSTVLIVLAPVAKSVLKTAAVVSTQSQVRSIEGRVDIWRQSIELARRHPLYGFGAYNFPMRYASYSEEHPSFVTGSYDYFLQILLERGILGLTAYLAVFLVFFWFCYRTSKQRDMGELQAAIVILSAAGCIAALVRDITFSSMLINKGAAVLMWFSFANAINATTGRRTVAGSIRAPARTVSWSGAE